MNLPIHSRKMFVGEFIELRYTKETRKEKGIHREHLESHGWGYKGHRREGNLLIMVYRRLLGEGEELA